MNTRIKMQNALRLTVAEAEAVLAVIAGGDPAGNVSRIHRALISAEVKLRKCLELARAPKDCSAYSPVAHLKRGREASREYARRQEVAEREEVARNTPIPFPRGAE